jgi:A/G-specific adenine glycosylase
MDDLAEKLAFFRNALLEWGAAVDRPLPWKGVRDPYIIWLSEILLQQTRAAQGLPYFLRFRERFPTVESLAAAPDDEVMKLWEGLGYYARAKNLLKTARIVAGEMGGKFPDTYEGLLALPGVGAYTAAAIASFAYDAPCAVLDGNVFRVLSRYLGIAEPVDTTLGKRIFTETAQAAIDTTAPAAYNQAIMDFGAVCCTPQTPQCGCCPLQSRCVAFAQGNIKSLPVKSKSIVKRERYFHYLVIEHREAVLLQKRVGKDIWENLYEFPLIETPAPGATKEDLVGGELWQKLLGPIPHTVSAVSPPFRQVLTHQHIHAVFWEIRVENEIPYKADVLLQAERRSLNKFAFPKVIDSYLKNGQLHLNLL